MDQSEVAIVGGGIGGLVAGLMLLRQGVDVQVYEQAPAFSRLGAGIQIGPNVMKIMRRLGLEGDIERLGSHPAAWISRAGTDGAVLAHVQLNERRDFYGAAYVTIHRGDFHQMLCSAFPAERLHFDRTVVALDERANSVSLAFADGTRADARIVIGADGVNSAVREALMGVEPALYTGYVGHRAIFPAARLAGSGLTFDACVKWWSEDRHLMAYYLDQAQETMYYVTGAPEPDWSHGTAFVPSSRDEMRAAFADYHPAVQAMIDASDDITKWPLLTRPPMMTWSRGRTVLLGDACHPMKPHMAQGAAMAVEDGAVLALCFARVGGTSDFLRAYELYEKTRLARATQVQAISNANTWLRSADDNPEWVYAYDVFAEPLEG